MPSNYDSRKLVNSKVHFAFEICLLLHTFAKSTSHLQNGCLNVVTSSCHCYMGSHGNGKDGSVVDESVFFLILLLLLLVSVFNFLS